MKELKQTKCKHQFTASKRKIDRNLFNKVYNWMEKNKYDLLEVRCSIIKGHYLVSAHNKTK